MTIPSAKPDAGERFVRSGITLLHRLAGLVLFATGVAYWVRLVGVFPGPNWRFDLMTLEWRVAVSTLAVLCPVAGVGMWLSTSWGTVVWTLIAAVEVVMHTVLRPTFGPFGPEAVSLCAGVVLLGTLRSIRWLQRRRNRQVERAG